jgi:restriction system protein
LFAYAEKDASELMASGTMTYLANRTHWGRTYLSKAGLLESPKRGQHRITQAGLDLLATRPDRIDIKLLSRFEPFAAWQAKSRRSTNQADIDPDTPEMPDQRPVLPGLTPDEQIARAHAEIESALSSDLLVLVQSMDPIRFEQLILDLLGKMGYGAGALASRRLTKASGDGGIDGIIFEDALGLDAVYIQAKRYGPDNKVSRPAIQQFVGSLTGEGATKGVFVTTSEFTRDARDFLSRVVQRIVLIDGATLARLMIRHEVGVRARQTYVLRSVDDDYFSDLA